MYDFCALTKIQQISLEIEEKITPFFLVSFHKKILRVNVISQKSSFF